MRENTDGVHQPRHGGGGGWGVHSISVLELTENEVNGMRRHWPCWQATKDRVGCRELVERATFRFAQSAKIFS